MTEPATVTTRHDTPLFDPEDHRTVAAAHLGLQPGDIHCTATGPDQFEVQQEAAYTEPVFSQDGTLLKPAELIQPRIVIYIRNTTWEARPGVPTQAQIPEGVPVAEEHPWPTVASRGVRWHGPVTIDGKTEERTFISDGKDMVLLNSPAGRAVLAKLAGENQAVIGG